MFSLGQVFLFIILFLLVFLAKTLGQKLTEKTEKLEAVRTHMASFPKSHSDWQGGKFKEWAKELEKILGAEG